DTAPRLLMHDSQPEKPFPRPGQEHTTIAGACPLHIPGGRMARATNNTEEPVASSRTESSFLGSRKGPFFASSPGRWVAVPSLYHHTGHRRRAHPCHQGRRIKTHRNCCNGLDRGKCTAIGFWGLSPAFRRNAGLLPLPWPRSRNTSAVPATRASKAAP